MKGQSVATRGVSKDGKGARMKASSTKRRQNEKKRKAKKEWKGEEGESAEELEALLFNGVLAIINGKANPASV